MIVERGRIEPIAKDMRDGRTPWNAELPEPNGVLRIVKPRRGNLKSLTSQAEPRVACRPYEARVETIAAALNFRDVLSALNRYPGDPSLLGAEFAGRVVEVGSAVAGLKTGQRVVGVTSGSFASEIVTCADVMAPIPDDLPPHVAVALPVSFLSAWRSFFELASLRPGQTALIHCATGGVGLAAIQLARQCGARVLATAGRAAKQAHLRSVGVADVFNSRDAGFAEDVLAATGGRGADFVLNALMPELFEANLRCIAPNGQFVEMGKNGLLPEGEIRRMRPDVWYRKLALDDDIQHDPKTVSRLLPTILEAVSSGSLAPPPVTRFPVNEAAEAFRFMARAQHIGKIVLDFPACATRPPLDDAEISAEPTPAMLAVKGRRAAVSLEVE